MKLKSKKKISKNIVHLDSIVENSKEDEDARSEKTLDADNYIQIQNQRNFELLQTLKQ